MTEVRSRTALFADPGCVEHDTGFGHPECPARFEAVLDALDTAGLTPRLLPLSAATVAQEQLRACHSEDYLRTVEEDVQGGAGVLRTGDTNVSRASQEVALSAVGGALAAVDAVCGGGARNAFVAARPPGHHAEAARGMGFCIYNNVALAARYAQQRHAVQRVMVLDWDVHHGNGTQQIFYEDDTVYFFSTHQSPWYPGTGDRAERGAGAGEGTTLNCPFPAGAGREEILGAFEREAVPAAELFRPDMILLSAGFDGHHRDPLGHFVLTEQDFADLTRVACQLADAYCGGRLVSFLEGGYHLDALGASVAAHVLALLAQDYAEGEAGEQQRNR